jgi:hypothetical protein
MSVGQMSFGQMSVGKMPINQYVCRPKVFRTKDVEPLKSNDDSDAFYVSVFDEKIL